MTESSFQRRLKFSRSEFERVLDRMDASVHPKAAEGRSRERFDYRVADIPLVIEHPSGGTVNFLVFGRNVSRSGVGVLHGGYVHPGSKCRIVLAKKDRTALAIDGFVAHCRLVAGSCHEIGVRFDEEIDPTDLLEISGADDGGGGDGEEGHFANFQGTIVVADSFAPELLLLEHQLSLFSLELRTASTPGAVLDTIKRERVDLVLLGLSLKADDGLRTVRLIRESGCKAPIMVLTAEDDQSLLKEASDAGATDIVHKPYNLDLLIAQLRAHLGEDQPRSVRFSTAASQPGMPELIAKFVPQARRNADQIERAYDDGDWDNVREYGRQLKGSGVSYGFQDVTVAAIGLLNAMERDPAAEETKKTMFELVKCCRTLEAKAA